MSKKPPRPADLRPLLRPWLRSLAERSPHTARAYERAVTRFLDTVKDLSMNEVTDYLDTLDGLAPSSRAHYVSAVRSFFKFAERAGVPINIPPELLARPRVSITSYNRYLTLEELRGLVEGAYSISPEHYAAVVALAGLGMRVEEATRANWGDLFTDPAGRLGIRILGKGGKERVVRVRDDVLEALAAARVQEIEFDGVEMDFEPEIADSEPLLTTSRGGRIAVRTLREYIYEARDVTTISKPVSPHFLRHTHATLAAYGGADIFTIQDSLGHAKMDTSAIYLHIARGLEDTTADYLPDFTAGVGA